MRDFADLSHLMLEPDSSSRHAMVADLGITIVAEHGWEALTPAALGKELGLTRQAVHQWFGDQLALRLVFAQHFAGRWSRWIGVRVYAHGLHGLLPTSASSRRWTRVWIALVDQGGRDADLGAILAHAREQEAEVLARHLASLASGRYGVPVSPLPVLTNGVLAAVEGLRVRACHEPESDLGACLELVAACHLRALVGGSCLTSSNVA